jgi:RNA polymerase sigma factor (sigma-70 family)
MPAHRTTGESPAASLARPGSEPISGRCARLDDTHASDSLGLLHAVWEEASPELAQVVRALGVDPVRSEDVLQDVYVAALEKRPAGLDADALRRWLFRVTVNRCRLVHRRRSRLRDVLRRVGRLAHRGNHAPAAAEVAAGREERELVRSALERLDPELREALVLRYFSGFDSKQIGEILEMPDSTVRSRLRTARRRLAAELRSAGYVDEQ